MLKEWANRVRQFGRRTRFDEELREEVHAHIEERAAELERTGMPFPEALRRAQREFGSVARSQEDSRSAWKFGWVEDFAADIRFGWRLLRRNPGFTAVVVLTLALGIGANTAIFQLLDAVRFRSLPIPNPQELAEVRIEGGNNGLGLNSGKYPQLTQPIWREIRNQDKAFTEVSAWGETSSLVGKGSETYGANILWVSGNFFRVLGIRPLQGRLILPEDEGSCPEWKAVVSYSYWQNRMGALELGGESTVNVGGHLEQVVGVTPPEFTGLIIGDSFDIARSICQSNEVRRDEFDVAVLGRLRPGWTLERATAQLKAISPGIMEATAPTALNARTVEKYKQFQLAAFPVSGGVGSLRTNYTSSLWLLLGITGLVLVIACANLANLMLARASTREREMAVRLALGASRNRLLRQLLVESYLTVGIGAALGIGLAQALSRVMVWAISTGSNRVDLSIQTDWRVLLFAVLVATATCAAFAVIPAIRVAGGEPVTAMRASGRGVTSGRRQFFTQRLMVVTQIAVSLVLVIGALMFVRSFRKLITFDPGMRESGVTVAILAFHQSNVAPARYEDFSGQLLDEVRAVPGILGAAITSNIPLTGGSWDLGVHAGSSEGNSMFTWVSPGYFQVMGIRLAAGRDFAATDTGASRRVAVVNQAFIRRYLGNANPIGQTIRTDSEPNYPSAVYEIVGVIPDTKYNDIRGGTPPITFAPASQFPAPGPFTFIMVHSNAPPEIVMSMVKRAIAEKHPEIVTVLGDFQTWIRDGLVRERLMAMLSGFLGLLAGLLAMLGLYGLISYGVARRRNEIGIRIALGARQIDVLKMIMRETIVLGLIGVAIGIPTGLAAARVASSALTGLLFGMKATDPLTISLAAFVMIAVAILAGFSPARRASRVEPTVALRSE